MCARRRSNFLLLRQKKVTKEKATLSLRPLRFARCKPASGRLRGAPWNSLCCCAAPLGQPRRVRSRSTRALTRVLTPQPPRRRRSQQGVDSRTSKQPHGSSLRSTQSALCPTRGTCARKMGPSEAMARMDVGCSAVLRPIPSVCAEERSGQRIRARDCLSEAQRSEFERDPAGREHRRLPEAKRRDADSGVAFSLLTFFWRSKRK